MDYAAEQEMELEALEAIFTDSLESKRNGLVPDGWCTGAIYRVMLKPTDEDDQVERKMALDFLFAYTANYPDEPPHIRLQSSYGLSNEEMKEIQSIVDEEVQNGIGMAMMFNIFETVKEWLRNRANVDAYFTLTAEEKRKLQEEEEERRMAEERSHGIPVTVETFAEWKVSFEAEIRQAASRNRREQRDPRLQRPTGKQLFLERMARFEEEGIAYIDDDIDGIEDDIDDDEEWLDDLSTEIE